MILPKDIKTRHKVRDAKIIRLYAHDNQTTEEIAQAFGMTHQNVSLILYKNKHVFELDKKFEKQKRLNKLNRMLAKTDDSVSKNRDATDIIKEMRAECEGDSNVNFISQFLNITPEFKDSLKNNRLLNAL